jgi:cytochrome P450
MNDSVLPSELIDPARPIVFDGFSWHVFAYPDVLRVMSDQKQFSADYSAFRYKHANYAVMWAYDDPRHRDLRALVKDPFHPAILAKLESDLSHMARSLLRPIREAGTGRFDIIHDFARPFATQAICTILGIDREEASQWLRWLDELVAAPSPSHLPPQEDMVARVRALLDTHRKHRGHGLIDELIMHEQQGYRVAGSPLEEWDLIGSIWGLFAAGVETTSTQIGNLLLACIEAGSLEEVQADRSLIGSAIEESMRWNPSFPAVRRTAVRQVQLSGATIEPGQIITAWISAANRDPGIFLDPDRFDIRRSPNRHLSFGHGTHFCLGAPLARLEMRTAMEVLLEQFGHTLDFDHEAPPRYRFGMVNQLANAHLLFGREEKR